MADSRVIITGQKAIAARLNEMIVRSPKVAEMALRTEAELIRTASMKMTPSDKGTLKGSHFVESKQTLDGPEATIGVGGAASAYALAVHEHPGPHDPPSWQGAGGGRSGAFSGTVQFKTGGPKFLERAASGAAPGMPKRLGLLMAQGLGWKPGI